VLWVDDKVLVVGCVGIIIYLMTLLFKIGSRFVGRHGCDDKRRSVHQKAPKHVVGAPTY
jgi:hypothetical protein